MRFLSLSNTALAVAFISTACAKSEPQARYSEASAATASGSQGTTGAPNGPPSSGSGLVLDLNAAKRESYAFEEVGAKEFLTFEKEHVRVSASCITPEKLLACDAMTALRKGKHVKLPANAPVGVSPGALACKQMGMKNRTGRAPSGNEDGFCLFPDGSMASTGSLDSYVIE
jgi:hypothetical protein